MNFNFNDAIVTIGTVKGVTGYTHDTIEVTVTDTMRQGSLLKADGTEVTQAEATQAVRVIDDLEFLRALRGGDGAVKAGDVLSIAAVTRGSILNDQAIYFKGGELIDTTAKKALGSDMKFTSIKGDSVVKQ